MTATGDTPEFRYNAGFADRIERKWQERWERQGTFVTPNPGQAGFDASRPKFYCLDMFPYPSGAGLHVGHPEGYTATDILCRFKRMTGFNVLHPMGYDAFGLPAEQYAIQTGVHPAVTTQNAIENFRRQLQRFGFSYDWSRELATIDPGYYKWTQWIFLQIYNAWVDKTGIDASGHQGFERQGRARPISELIDGLERGVFGVDPSGEIVALSTGGIEAITGSVVGVKRWHELTQEERREVIDGQRLAYLGEQMVNWCPKLGTVLANDEVIDGRSERGGHPVVRQPLRQWQFRITAFAGRLLDDLKGLDWPESTKAMQAEWIGRSEGAEIEFDLAESKNDTLLVYTTRPDTIFGATYMVIAPEHALAARAMEDRAISAETRDRVRQYVDAARRKSDVDRQADSKEKTGVFSGLHTINPLTGARIPIWVADYVLMGYGTGAIMAVPAHDQRDYEFAKAFGLPIRDVVYPRAMAAMHFFARSASRSMVESGSWMIVLADFLGHVATHATPPKDFARVLDEVAKRAAEQPDPKTCHVDAAIAAVELPGFAAQKKSVSRMTWLDAIEGMGITSFDALATKLLAGRIAADAGHAMDGDGFLVNSSTYGVTGHAIERHLDLDGMSVPEAKKAIAAWLEETGYGRARMNYRLRDWLFSRQRYWGEPFPIVFDAAGNHYPVSDSALPVTLPELEDYLPVESAEPQPLLAKATAWANTTAGAAGVDPNLLPPETPVRRECNTMPGSAGSSWYYLRYCDAKNGGAMADPRALSYWLGEPAQGSRGGVDLYMGGSEHAVGHLLYVRFWTKVLHDLGVLPVGEPAQRLFHQGMITSFAYQRSDKTLVPVDQVREEPEGSGKFIEIATGAAVSQVVAKMSKSLKNVINPDDVIAEFGADTFRLYEMYMGPLEASKPWNPRDIAGCYRFLQRAWRLMVDESTGQLRVGETPDAALEKELHRLTKKVGEDIERLAFNTAIAAMMSFINVPDAGAMLTRSQIERLALVLAPFCPHMAEEVWEKLGHTDLIAHARWPSVDAALLVDNEIEVPVQVNGKVKARIMVAVGADAKAVEALAMKEPKVIEAIAGKPVKKVVVPPGNKLVSVVV